MSSVYVNCSERLNSYLHSFNLITGVVPFLFLCSLELCLGELVKLSN